MKVINFKLFKGNDWRDAASFSKYINAIKIQESNIFSKNLKLSNARFFNEWKIVTDIIKIRANARSNDNLMMKLISEYSLSSESFPLLHFLNIPQFYFKGHKKLTKVLFCITGHANQLNMPLPLFHNIAWNHYDGIAYFFTNAKNFYLGEEKILISQMERLTQAYDFGKIDMVASSGGGPVALSIPKQLVNGSKLIASPPILRVDWLIELFRKGNFSFLDETMIIFASKNNLDSRHYDFAKELLPSQLFSKIVIDVFPGYKKHSTLLYCACNGILNKFMETR
ncbi:hypothetical protein OAE71_00195 [Synechococcus sp. AH-551-A21]|nr:hypothetical protein [Synechococcus sp. AH-551-A21]MDB4677564.1 hypothetical protein [Synechococcus sp. AH-551-A21]